MLTPEQLPDDQRAQLWSMVEPSHLEGWVQNGEWLIKLLKLKQKQLPDAQRTQLWNMVEPRHLEEWIQDPKLLIDLSVFAIAPHNLPDAQQRAELWRMLEPHMGKLIINPEELAVLFGLEPEELPIAERDKILTAIQPSLKTWFQQGRQMKELFELPLTKLSADHRNLIVEAQKSNSGSLGTANTLFHHRDEREDQQKKTKRPRIE